MSGYIADTFHLARPEAEPELDQVAALEREWHAARQRYDAADTEHERIQASLEPWARYGLGYPMPKPETWRRFGMFYALRPYLNPSVREAREWARQAVAQAAWISDAAMAKRRQDGRAFDSAIIERVRAQRAAHQRAGMIEAQAELNAAERHLLEVEGRIEVLPVASVAALLLKLRLLRGFHAEPHWFLEQIIGETEQLAERGRSF